MEDVQLEENVTNAQKLLMKSRIFVVQNSYDYSSKIESSLIGAMNL